MIAGRKIRKLWRRLGEMHPGLVLVILLLSAYGILMQYSASGGTWSGFAVQHTIKWGVAVCMCLGIALLPVRALFGLSYVVYGGCVLLLILVEIAGEQGGGATRWVRLGFVQLQPSELMKIGLIIAFARYFHSVNLESSRHYMLLFFPALLLAIPAVLILLQPNLGTALILITIAGCIAFMAGIRAGYFVGVIALVGAAVPVLYQFLHPYQQQRVMTFLNPERDPLGAGYNIIQSKIAIGSGGFLGKGLLQGSQGQLDFLPEKQTDFIFTMVAEELGFLGAGILLVLYGLLIGYGMMVMLRCRHQYGRMLAAGVVAMLSVHIFINMAMVMGMLPVVGVPLPFLSYGGSFLMGTMLACGLLLHVDLTRSDPLPRRQSIG
jgi:rod shape determining protein RodA